MFATVTKLIKLVIIQLTIFRFYENLVLFKSVILTTITYILNISIEKRHLAISRLEYNSMVKKTKRPHSDQSHFIFSNGYIYASQSYNLFRCFLCVVKKSKNCLSNKIGRT